MTAKNPIERLLELTSKHESHHLSESCEVCVEIKSLIQQIQQAISFHGFYSHNCGSYGCAKCEYIINSIQNQKIVDEIRMIVDKESEWLKALDNKYSPYFDYREIIKKLQQLVEKKK